MPLKFTKNQTLILEIFFNNPDKSYYLRQLGRFLDKEPGVFQKDINKGVEQSGLTSERQGSIRLFALNKNHLLYPELKKIFFKTIGTEGKLKALVNSIKDIKVAFIFGSFAQDKEDSFSDVDLMIIGSPDEDLLVSKVSSLESRLGREINYSIFSERDWKKEIKEKNSFLENILAKEKLFLIGNEKDLSKIFR